MLALFLLLVISCSLQLRCEGRTAGEKEVLYLLSLLPYFNEEPTLNPSWHEGDCIAPALHLAQDQVNAHPNILQNHRLELIMAQGGCQQVSRTIVSYVEEAYHRGRRIAGIIGPACSSSSIALAPLTNRSEMLLVMLHGSGSPTLADRKLYPHHLGTLGSTENFVSALLYLLQNWKRVAIVFEEARLFYTDTKDKLIEKLKNTAIVEYLSPVSLYYLPLDVIRKELLRVVFVMCSPQLSRQLICFSLHLNMTYSNYQWVFMAHTESALVSPVKFRYHGETISCSEAEMAAALSHHILLVYSMNSFHTATLQPLNTTYEQYLVDYESYIDQYNARGAFVGKKSTTSDWTNYFYDSVWAWALVLDNLTKVDPNMFRMNTSQLCRKAEHVNLIMEQFYNTKFDGISGSISYSRSTGFTPRTINLFQITNEGKIRNQSRLLARIHSHDDIKIYSHPVQISDTFPEENVRENKHLARCFAVIAAMQFLVTVCLHVVTRLNVEHPAIKASTPKLLHMSYTGVYIMLLGVFFYILHPAVPLAINIKGIFCQVFWGWTFPIGFTLAVGPVAMRTWRVYRIFVHFHNPGHFISNPVLISAVLMMLLVDILLAMTWTLIDCIETNLNMEKRLHTNLQLMVLQVQGVCMCTHFIMWKMLLIFNKFVLLLFFTALTFLTRNIRNLSFTTNSLRVLVYLTAFITIPGVSFSFFLPLPALHPNYNFIALFGTMFALSSVLQVCVFLPPLLPTLTRYNRQMCRKKGIGSLLQLFFSHSNSR